MEEIFEKVASIRKSADPIVDQIIMIRMKKKHLEENFTVNDEFKEAIETIEEISKQYISILIDIIDEKIKKTINK